MRIRWDGQPSTLPNECQSQKTKTSFLFKCAILRGLCYLKDGNGDVPRRLKLSSERLFVASMEFGSNMNGPETAWNILEPWLKVLRTNCQHPRLPASTLIREVKSEQQAAPFIVESTSYPYWVPRNNYSIKIWQCVKTLYPCSSHQNSW